ncbi:hypothetical protein [Brevundimonas sp. AAP58]|uniref:hypothetical protein n=1 Tax=Brevundimonas sp. AAP58 TaxID=1523422 RepID=UPI0009E9EB61|nr:hypothetical protein [Brevundimonas sp. AAP58]
MIRGFLTRPIGPLAPLGWLIAGVAVLIAVGFLASAWDRMWAWLPWSDERRADRAETRADVAEDRALSAELEAEGQADQVRRIDTYAHQILTIQTETAAASAAARSAPDADTPLDPARADRLRHHDGELCRTAPDLAGCSPALDAP